MYFVEIAVYSLIVVLFFILIISNLRQRVIIQRLGRDVEQGLIDYLAISEKMQEALKNNDQKKIEETEGFLKFVSDSRDWAFQYIERVQIAIKDFQNTFHPVAEKYYRDRKTYGLDPQIDPVEFGKLFEAYKKLVAELPEEGKSD
jgi:hypothetical protein